MTEVIASRDNERVKRACKLRDSGARRAAEGRFLAEGLRLCTDLAQRLPPEEVYCTKSCWMRTRSLPPWAAGIFW